MGCGGSSLDVDPEQRKRHNVVSCLYPMVLRENISTALKHIHSFTHLELLAIEADLAIARKDAQCEVKLLLLGTGASGKSTIAKQMKLLYLKGFSEKEASIFTEIIYFNLIKNTKVLAVNTLKFGYELLPQNKKFSDSFQNLTVQLSDVELTEDRMIAMQSLWDDPACQKAMQRSNEFQIDDNASYFFSQIERITSPQYVPTIQDILHVRAKTIGIVETEFVHHDLKFRLVDVGGQRTERRKWIHAFESVTAIMFIVAVSEYDQLLEEDGTTNRMHESLKLFADMANHPLFNKTNIILFLNKKDIFEEKIKIRPLTLCFDNYDGPEGDYDHAMNFILKKFQRRDKTTSRELYHHFTCATDTKNVEFCFEATSDIFLKGNLVNGGFY